MKMRTRIVERMPPPHPVADRTPYFAIQYLIGDLVKDDNDHAFKTWEEAAAWVRRRPDLELVDDRA